MVEVIKISMRAARVNADLRLIEAANKLGISANTLTAFEKGKAIPSWDMAKKMSDVYCFPVDNIIFTRESA